MTKSAAEVEMEVEASRGKLDATVEALKDKMTPGQLFDEASHAMGGAGQQLLSKFIDQAKENPMPVALMGVGLAWLMTTSGKSRVQSSASRAATSGAGRSASLTATGVGDKLQALGSKAADVLSDAKDTVTSKAASAQDSMGGMVHDLSGKADSLKGKAGDYSQQAMQGAKDLIDREPLLLAALGVIVGAGLATALPATSMEDKAIGPVRDDLVERGKSVAHDSVDKAVDTAQAAYAAVKSEVQKAVGNGSDSPPESHPA